MAGTAAEQAQVAFDILRSVSDPVDNHIKFIAGEHLRQAGLIDRHISLQQTGAWGQRIFTGNTAVEQKKFEAAFQGQVRAGRTDQAGATDK